MKKVSLTVSAEEAGIRLDLFLVRKIQGVSRASVQKLIESGSVGVNSSPPKPSHKIRCGEEIEVTLPELAGGDSPLNHWNLPLEILYEDESILALNKPSGIVMHPGAGNQQRTLANALVSFRPETRHVGHPQRPGIVHRLDKETSGLVMVAKTQAAYLMLSAMFKERKIHKHYRALAYGNFPQKLGKIDRSLGRDPRDRKRISVRARKSREAVTLYRVLQQYPFGGLLDVHLLTGRTHQIRVHLSYEGHPIIGDTRYGGGNWNRILDPQLRAALKQAHFFGLHAFSLDLTHPLSGVDLHLEAPLPEVWRKIQSPDPTPG